jgi:hypothetical protein
MCMEAVWVGVPLFHLFSVLERFSLYLLRASPIVLSMRFQTVKYIVKKSKCVSLAQEIGFFAPNLCSFQWLVKVVIQLCTSKNECNKLNLTEVHSL